ncbi:SPOR domain-containing protein [Streptomyces sp. NPDC017988]|uniref:SPOR domain-containing protein n=1 Tax=Streptomyces sp. NPDC017988 TaxID=3365025 RepID=UPI0037AACF12
MEAVGAIVALLVVLFLVLGVYATVKVVRAAKRGVDRTISEARRTVEDTTLRAKSFAQVGTAGELAQLRLKLRTSMRSTQDVLQAGVVEDTSLKESLGLFDRLSAHGHELDDELRRLERDPDKASVAERLPELKERTEHITQAADSLRWGARDRASRFAGDDLESLRTQIDMEAGALRHWTTEPRPEETPAAWPEPAAEPAKDTGQTWPEPSAQASQEPTRPAITPPSAAPTYPWEKKAKPESTT